MKFTKKLQKNNKIQLLNEKLHKVSVEGTSSFFKNVLIRLE